MSWKYRQAPSDIVRIPAAALDPFTVDRTGYVRTRDGAVIGFVKTVHADGFATVYLGYPFKHEGEEQTKHPLCQGPEDCETCWGTKYVRGWGATCPDC